MADPGFLVGGGANPIEGCAYHRYGDFWTHLHVKIKEFAPIGGGTHRGAPPPGSATESLFQSN